MENIDQVIWDVIIVGAGPGGSAAAIELAKQNLRVLVVEKHSCRFLTMRNKLGESLAPFALDSLRKLLGSLECLDERDFGFRYCAGNLSCWHTKELQLQDFYFTPQGSGLCLNRRRFDLALLNKAKAHGACVIDNAQFVQCDRSQRSDHWMVEIKTNNVHQQFVCQYLIDASGRNSVVSKNQGINKQKLDNLFAFSRRYTQSINVTNRVPDQDRFTRLEAVPDGWWYSNIVPSIAADERHCVNERVLVFHSDLDLKGIRDAATASGYDDFLATTHHLQHLLNQFEYQSEGRIQGASAATERLAAFAKEGWFAVGDAAMTFDPLSSQGIAKAIHTGLLSAELICAGIWSQKENGHRQADVFIAKRYCENLEQIWQTYRKEYRQNYHLQQRWSHRPFWTRRHQNNEPVKHREAP